ncbi:MAG TPA: hypothetical protein VJU86_16040 [Pyrinomonadaceae bacterium]|nr:hypothetical protein [Pyrinomonadaceae bacterium]
MNCQSFEATVIDIVRRQPIAADVLEQSLAHADECSNCARQLEEQRMLSSELRGLSEQMKLVHAPERIENEFLVALRRKKFQPQRGTSGSRKWVGVAAIAAVLLVVFGVVALRSKQMPVAHKPAQVNNPTPESNAGVVPEVAVNVTPTFPFTKKRVVRKPTPRIRRATKVEVSSLMALNAPPVPEITTQFMPLGDVSLANLQDGAQVVRVEMPRYAMARFGLPVNMDRYDETVKADIWLGIDGLARAIRFVQ